MSGSTLNKKAGSEFESAHNYFMLLKPRVMSLAIFTALVGQILASHQSFKNPMLTFISLFSKVILDSIFRLLLDSRNRHLVNCITFKIRNISKPSVSGCFRQPTNLN